MLPGVLLHVIEPPHPVDRAMQRGRRGRPIYDVKHAAVLRIDDVKDADVVEEADVVRLAAGRGIERRPVEHERSLAVMRNRLDEVRVELAKVRIGVIDAVCFHRMTGSIAPASRNPLARSTQLSHRPHGRPSGRGS